MIKGIFVLILLFEMEPVNVKVFKSMFQVIHLLKRI